jgi:uncharacterized protein YcgI (DUF1989 family)
MQQMISRRLKGGAESGLGETLRITTPKGAQAADFFAFNCANVGEWLSPNHSWVFTRHVRPRKGDVFLSRFRRPMLEFIEDGAAGTHDMMIARLRSVSI